MIRLEHDTERDVWLLLHRFPRLPSLGRMIWWAVIAYALYCVAHLGWFVFVVK